MHMNLPVTKGHLSNMDNFFGRRGVCPYQRGTAVVHPVLRVVGVGCYIPVTCPALGLLTYDYFVFITSYLMLW